jgi:hypothetical protein
MSTGQKKMPAGPAVARDAGSKPDGLVSHYPLSSVLVVFGIGLGVGVALESLLGGPVAPPPSLGKRTELAAERLGRQMLDAIAGVLPESLSKHIS